MTIIRFGRIRIINFGGTNNATLSNILGVTLLDNDRPSSTRGTSTIWYDGQNVSELCFINLSADGTFSVRTVALGQSGNVEKTDGYIRRCQIIYTVAT